MEDRIRLVKDYDAILERCYAQNMGGGATQEQSPGQSEIIKTEGEHVTVDTDGGADRKSKLGAGFRGIYAISG